MEPIISRKEANERAAAARNRIVTAESERVQLLRMRAETAVDAEMMLINNRITTAAEQGRNLEMFTYDVSFCSELCDLIEPKLLALGYNFRRIDTGMRCMKLEISW